MIYRPLGLKKLSILGSIDLDELIDIICTFYDMEGVPRKESKRHAKRIFEALDEDGQFYQHCLFTMTHFTVQVTAAWTRTSLSRAASLTRTSAA